MSEVSYELEQLQQLKVASKKLIDLGEAVDKLMRNREFKKVILEHYCVEECARYVQASCDPNLPEASRADCLALAQASGHLLRFLDVLKLKSAKAYNDLENIDKAVLELNQEDLFDEESA